MLCYSVGALTLMSCWCVKKDEYKRARVTKCIVSWWICFDVFIHHLHCEGDPAFPRRPPGVETGTTELVLLRHLRVYTPKKEKKKKNCYKKFIMYKTETAQWARLSPHSLQKQVHRQASPSILRVN